MCGRNKLFEVALTVAFPERKAALIAEEIMKVRTLLLSAIAVGVLSTPALADFWIVRDGPTAQCRIVETKPADTKVTIVGNTVYKTRNEATKEMAVVCK
jgi:hypothetical protein